MLGALLGAVAIAAGLASAPGGATLHETTAERLYRKGVYCMEELERSKCAIEKFEQLLDERTNDRELVTDAMLRLVKLYQLEERNDDIAPVTRRFWDVGMNRRSRGHVPYATRFFPPEFDMLMAVHVQRIANAPLSKQLGKDVVDLMFTCNAVRRTEINERRRWRKAQEIAKKEGKTTIEVIYERQDKARAEREKWEKQREESGRQSHTPVFGKAVCPTMEALGRDDVLGVVRGVGGMNHGDFRESMAVIEIPGLGAKLAAAERAGTIRRVGDRRWALPELDYHGKQIHLGHIDRDELLIAPAHYVGGMFSARAKGKRRLNRDLDKMLGTTPRDVGFFLLMTSHAMKAMMMQDMSDGQRTLAEMLLPRPKGIQITGVFQEYFGLFMRMPTDTPAKGRLLVNVARMIIDSEAESDAEAADFLRNLDVAESTDRRALLLSYVIAPAQMRKVMMD